MTNYLLLILIFSCCIIGIINLLYGIEAKSLVLSKKNNKKTQKRMEHANKLLKIRLLLMIIIFITIIIFKYLYE